MKARKREALNAKRRAGRRERDAALRIQAMAASRLSVRADPISNDTSTEASKRAFDRAADRLIALYKPRLHMEMLMHSALSPKHHNGHDA